MPTTSAGASNLSLPQYGYDLVVATTQDAVNATITEFLSGFKGEPFVACYKNVRGHHPEPMDYDKVRQAIGGDDPFTIPNGADENNERVEKLAALDFLFAFRAKMSSLSSGATLVGNLRTVERRGRQGAHRGHR